MKDLNRFDLHDAFANAAFRAFHKDMMQPGHIPEDRRANCYRGIKCPETGEYLYRFFGGNACSFGPLKMELEKLDFARIGQKKDGWAAKLRGETEEE